MQCSIEGFVYAAAALRFRSHPEPFPGWWLAAGDLLAGNMAKVLLVLQEGLASPTVSASSLLMNFPKIKLC
jgi:hypothetical protein